MVFFFTSINGAIGIHLQRSARGPSCCKAQQSQTIHLWHICLHLTYRQQPTTNNHKHYHNQQPQSKSNNHHNNQQPQSKTNSSNNNNNNNHKIKAHAGKKIPLKMEPLKTFQMFAFSIATCHSGQLLRGASCNFGPDMQPVFVVTGFWVFTASTLWASKFTSG